MATTRAAGVGAIRNILKNKNKFTFELRSKETEGKRTTYLFDVFYDKTNGTLNIGVEEGEIKAASLNLSYGKVFNLYNDTNLKKLCTYVLEQVKE